jgi:DNA repair protein RadC
MTPAKRRTKSAPIGAASYGRELRAAVQVVGEAPAEYRQDPPTVDRPDAVARYIREAVIPFSPWWDPEVEQLLAVFLNTRKKPIGHALIGRGLLDQILVHAREVFRPAIAANAHGVILAHNHPSGDPTPSEADIRVTREMIRCGHMLKIDLLDHIVLGERQDGRLNDFVSLRELGYFHT